MFDSHALNAAAFVVQALDLEDTPESLAGDVIPFKRDANTGVSTIELDSTVGAAGFLIYDYRLDVVDQNGASGRQRFDADLGTLERSTERNTPGPRILAHAISGDNAFILATSPAVFRAMTGQSEETATTRNSSTAELESSSITVRSAEADELLRLLREADVVALRWLRAIQADGAGIEDDDLIEFSEAERALALFLIDEGGIPNLLRAMNLFISSATDLAHEVLDQRGTGLHGV